jgi:hypothetical protein
LFFLSQDEERLEVVGTCRTSQFANPLPSLAPPSTHLLKKRFRQERQRRRLAEDEVVQLKAALQTAQNKIRRLQGHTAAEEGQSEHGRRPFDKETDFLFSSHANSCNEGHKTFTQLVGPWMSSYAELSSVNEKQEMRRALVLKFMQEGGLFYQFNSVTQEATPVDLDEALWLSGPVLSRLRGKEREKEKSMKNMLRVRERVSRAQPRSSLQRRTTVHRSRPYNPESDYVFSFTGGLPNRGNNALRQLAMPHRTTYKNLANSIEKQQMRHALLQTFVAGGGQFYQWDREREEAVQVGFDEAAALSGAVISRVYGT